MFKIIEFVSNPIRLIPIYGNKFVPGTIVSLVGYQCEVSNGERPFGFANNYVDATAAENYELVTVFFSRLVFRTDVYDKSSWGEYITGSELYIDNSGIFTVDRVRDGQLSVGKIITGPSERKPDFEAIWY